MKMKTLFLLVAIAVASTVLAGEPAEGIGRLNNIQFSWHAVEQKTGLVELVFDRTIPLHAGQIERLRHLPDGSIIKAEGLSAGELSGITIVLNGGLDEGLSQAVQMVPGLALRRVESKENKVDNPKRIVAERR